MWTSNDSTNSYYLHFNIIFNITSFFDFSWRIFTINVYKFINLFFLINVGSLIYSEIYTWYNSDPKKLILTIINKNYKIFIYPITGIFFMRIIYKWLYKINKFIKIRINNILSLIEINTNN